MVSTHLKKYSSNWVHLPQIGKKIKKYLKPPQYHMSDPLMNWKKWNSIQYFFVDFCWKHWTAFDKFPMLPKTGKKIQLNIQHLYDQRKKTPVTFKSEVPEPPKGKKQRSFKMGISWGHVIKLQQWNSSWWLSFNQPLWKICNREIGSWTPRIRVNIKKYVSWKTHPELWWPCKGWQE